jgi:glycosyltransferase involved in cell wall biosynthesis
MNSPKVSILMPAYNCGAYIAESIESVLNQTFTQFYLVIVDDGSTDETSAIIRSYKDDRIKLVSRKNGGVSAALNTGLNYIETEYTARFDADDVCYPQRIQRQFEFLETHPDYIMVGSDADYMSDEGEYLFTYRNIGHTDVEIKERINTYCPFIHSTVMFRTENVKKLGGYEVKAHTFEDYFLWKRLIVTGRVYNFEEPLIRVRFNPASVTVDEKDRDPLFVEIKNKALKTGIISDEDETLLLKSIRKLSVDAKKASYHRMLAKKYLWNNYQPSKARKHLAIAITIEPTKAAAYFLFILSFVPKFFITYLYNRKKT